MKLDKILRVLVCLALVCCIVLNVAAMPARALDFGSWILHQIGTDIGVSAILEGLGIFRDSASDYFGELVDEVSDALDTAGLVSVGLMNAYYKADPLGTASPLFALPLSLILFVRNWLFDNDVVQSFDNTWTNSVSVNGYTINFSYPLGVATFSYYRNGYSSGYQIAVFSHNPGRVYCVNPSGLESSINLTRYISDNNVYYGIIVGDIEEELSYNYHGSYYYPNPTSAISVAADLARNLPSSVVTSNNLQLRSILPPSVLFETAYPQWLEHQRELEDGSTETVVQIGLGNTQAETESLTQEQIWTGQGTLQIPEQDQEEVHTPVLLPGWLQQGLENMRLGLQDILTTLQQLPQLLVQELAKIFVPSQDYITVKVEALRGEFGFIDSVIATGQFIRDSISGDSGPPVIYVDLGRAPSGNYGSQRVLLTDFSWYAPYKGQVDTVLSAALWAFFGWRVFLKLPGIIGGESGYISDVFFSSSSGRSGSDDKKKGGKG